MRLLSQILKNSEQIGVVLPDVSQSLSERGVLFRRAQLHMVAAQPGGGKTLLALWYAIKAQVPTLYFSADSDSRTIVARTAAVVSNQTVRESEVLLTKEDPFTLGHLMSVSHIRFDFDPNPSLQDIEDEIHAYIELFGDTPELIVVDNLMNIAQATDNEWTAMRDAMSAFHYLARETEAAFLILHHVSENDSRPNFPAPRKALQGKVSQLPEMVLTVAIDAPNDQFKVACVKNRHGAAHPMADEYVTLFVDAERMSLFNSQTDLHMNRTRAEYR